MSFFGSFFGEEEDVDLGFMKVSVTVDNQVLQSGDVISGAVRFILLKKFDASGDHLDVDVGLSLHGVCYFDNKRIQSSHFPDYLQPISDNKFDVFATPTVPIASNLALEIDEVNEFVFEVGLPNALPCSFVGRFVKFVYFVTVHIDTEKKSTLCRQQFDVVPRETIAVTPLLVPLNLREHRFIHQSREKALPSTLNPSNLLQTETSMKCSQGFRVMVDNVELGVLRVSHTYIERGEVFLGVFTFSEQSALTRCTKVLAELRHSEIVEINDNLRNTKVYCSQHKFVANTMTFHLEWQIPLFVPLSFETNLVSSAWHLVFEFHREIRQNNGELAHSIFKWELPLHIIQHQSVTRKVKRTKSVKLTLQ